VESGGVESVDLPGINFYVHLLDILNLDYLKG
jgi:hypothetical protein